MHRQTIAILFCWHAWFYSRAWLQISDVALFSIAYLRNVLAEQGHPTVSESMNEKLSSRPLMLGMIQLNEFTIARARHWHDRTSLKKKKSKKDRTVDSHLRRLNLLLLLVLRRASKENKQLSSNTLKKTCCNLPNDEKDFPDDIFFNIE